MVIYALLNSENYCMGMSELTNRVENEYMIEVEVWSDSYLYRKYDKDKSEWTDEYMSVPDVPPKVTLESIKSDTAPIKETTTLTADDALTIMEIQLSNEDKLNRILAHLGLQ